MALKTQIVNLMEAGEQVAPPAVELPRLKGENIVLDGEAVAAVQAFVRVFIVAFPL
jgi:hypothetical protein